jgi:hypothetical protein
LRIADVKEYGSANLVIFPVKLMELAFQSEGKFRFTGGKANSCSRKSPTLKLALIAKVF